MAMDKINYLKVEWDNLQLSGNAYSSLLFDKLIQQYSMSQRFYHNCDHLVHLFELLHQYPLSEPVVYWATFYHDYVYIAGNKDNEIQSAKIAAAQMSELGIDQSIINQTCYLIEATAQHDTEEVEWMNAFLDADMAILGVMHEDYICYQGKIRKEFSTIPDFLFNRGRKKFLQRSLEEDRLFKTEWFFNRFEEQARKNIQWELTVL